MENLLLLSVFVLLGALYVHQNEQKLVQIKDELHQHGNEIKKGQEGLGSTNKELIQVKEELESTNKALKEVNVDLVSTRKEVKQAQIEIESTKREVQKAQIKLELTRNELQQVKVELESTGRELKQAQVELESMKKEVKEAQVEFKSTRNELQQVKVEMESTKKEVKQVKVEFDRRAEVKQVKEELDKIEKELHTQRPAFYATMSASSMSVGQSQRIQFDHTRTDITNNYDKKTGVFTVPRDGHYYFSLTIFSLNGQIHAEIMQNGRVIGKTVGFNSYISTSINVVISCRQKDVVFVRHMAGMGAQIIYGAEFTAFSGFLID